MSFFLPSFPVPSSLPDVSVTSPAAAAAAAALRARRSGARRRRSGPDLPGHRPGHRRPGGVRPLPTGVLPAIDLHGDEQERVRAVPAGLLHGAVELHRQVSALRRVRPRPGGEDAVRRAHRLPVRVQTGALPQGGVRHVRPTQRVRVRARGADPR